MNVIREIPDWTIEYKILDLLSNSILSMKEISCMLDIKISSTRKTVDRMKKKKMIELKKFGNDENAYIYVYGVTQLFKDINK